MQRPRIAMLTIGKELLNGSVADTNSAYAAKRLRELGAELHLIVTVPDDINEIAEALRWMKGRFDYIITSGGIGSTHDDVTMAGIASALDQQVIRHPYLKTIVGRFCETTDLTAAQLRLAELPEKAELLVEDDMHIPQIYVDNIFILPGIPEYFRVRFERLAERFKGQPRQHDEITVKGLETQFTATLYRAVKLHSGVEFGSYPQLLHESAEAEVPECPTPCHIRITLESDDEAKLAAAKQFLVENIPDDMELIAK